MTTARPSDRSTLPTPMQTRTLGFLLREVYGHLQERVYAAVVGAGHPGVRAMHSPVLRNLPPDGGRVADLARATGLAKQSVSYVVEDLVALGYLQVGPDAADGRARRVAFTARGRRLLAALASAGDEAEQSLRVTLGAGRVQALRDTLEAALASLPSAPVRTATPRAPSGRPRAARSR